MKSEILNLLICPECKMAFKVISFKEENKRADGFSNKYDKKHGNRKISKSLSVYYGKLNLGVCR